MKKIVVNNTLLLFLSVNDFGLYENNDLLSLKNHYLSKYDNCIIYNYFDIKNNKKIIKDKINKLKFQNQIKINARKCDVRNIDIAIKNEFLKNNHIQGADKSQLLFGAYHQNDLIAVMTFDTSSAMNGGLNVGEFVLSRFAIKSGIIVVGIFNKILNVFIKSHSPRKIISFGDLNLMKRNDNIYLNNNFKLHHVIKPDYKYYHKKNDTLYHKFTYGNKYFKNPKISSEEKERTKNELIKLWNCGKIKYELTINESNESVFGFVYMIHNKINGKKYIGQTIRLLEKRIYEYKSNFNLKNHNNPHLYNAFNKYGWDNFDFSIIDTATTLVELNEKEIKYIRQYKSNQKEFGYNIELGGKNAIPDTETLERMSKSHIGIKQTENWINKRIAKAGSDEAKKYGKPKSEEERENLSEKSPKYWLGKNRSEETIKKISDTKKKIGLSEKQKNILCKKVYKIDLNKNNIIEYDSTKQASVIEGVNQSTISRWCKNEKNINGFVWKY